MWLIESEATREHQQTQRKMWQATIVKKAKMMSLIRDVRVWHASNAASVGVS